MFSHRCSSISSSRPSKRWRLLLFFLVLIICTRSTPVFAHQAPTTMVLLDVSPGKVAMELQLPLPELELAFGHDITKDPETVLDRFGPQIKEYLKAHIHPYINKNMPWLVEIDMLRINKGRQEASGPPFWEIIAYITLKPQPGEDTRHFILDYDVIMHQVINHPAFVSIRNDWETGKAGDQSTEVGVIRVDTRDNVIYPLEINLEKGSWWKGFRGMFSLGMSHIKEGTDHLLFLIVLLLPAMLIANGKKWQKFGGVKYSVVRLLKIVTAFTIGHSLTLLVGALGWVRLPTQPIEILIAFSILVSAIHAIRPIFPGKEIYIAAGFGLIHGLAFASILSNLHLGAGPMALSILGFNLGIEFMQVVIVALIVPWLIMLSQTPVYKGIRIIGASLAGIAALAWITERSSGYGNFITKGIEWGSPHAIWLIAVLALAAIILYIKRKTRSIKYN